MTDTILFKIKPQTENQSNTKIKDFWGSNSKRSDTPLDEIDIRFVSYIPMLPGFDKCITRRNR